MMNAIARGEKNIPELLEYLAKDAERHPADAFRLMFTSNHDENSWAGTEFERMGDAAKLMGGLGVCGRKYCCAGFLSDFVQVTIKMAKEQNFSLNSAKVSGSRLSTLVRKWVGTRDLSSLRRILFRHGKRTSISISTNISSVSVMPTLLSPLVTRAARLRWYPRKTAPSCSHVHSLITR